MARPSKATSHAAHAPRSPAKPASDAEGHERNTGGCKQCLQRCQHFDRVILVDPERQRTEGRQPLPRPRQPAVLSMGV